MPIFIKYNFVYFVKSTNLSFHLKKVEKEQMKPEIARRRRIRIKEKKK